MQGCLQCGESFKYKKIINSYAIRYKPIMCDNCGQVHRITLGSRLIVALAVVVFPMITILVFFGSVTLTYSILIYLLIAISMVFLLPYVLKYEKRH
jgi:CXXC-20-CXXC protein